ncbi:hypothetical protein J22TS3_21110 [Paenibacillus sp. J22TS3]|nr:hypothetical protein J22TS3_21110 [Paenibacillus sp. J22TS3]
MYLLKAHSNSLRKLNRILTSRAHFTKVGCALGCVMRRNNGWNDGIESDKSGKSRLGPFDELKIRGFLEKMNCHSLKMYVTIQK